MTSPRVLFVDAFGIAVNPTATLAHALVASAFPGVMAFGPGYSSHQEVSAGLMAFVQQNGPFDIAVFGPGVPLWASGADPVADAAAHLSMFAALTATRPRIEAGLRDILGAADALPIAVKATWLLNFDYYAATTEQVAAIERRGFVVLGPNEQFVGSLADLPDYARGEKHYERKRARLSDAFRDWLIANPSKVIPLPHFVGEAEFTARSLDDRAYDVAVPGVEYVLRKKAVEKLNRSGLAIAPKRIFHLYRVLRRVGLQPLSYVVGQRLYQAAFQQTLMDTKLVFTARGGFGIPIRKFFEIPAAGALMACVPPVGFAALGYEAGRTHLECEPEALAQTAQEWAGRSEEGQAIARRGQELTARAHSIGARARQLRTALEAVLAGRYGGAEWRAGEFVIRGSA